MPNGQRHKLAGATSCLSVFALTDHYVIVYGLTLKALDALIAG